MKWLRLTLVLAVLGLGADSLSADDEPPAPRPWGYPEGESTQTIEGLDVTLYVPGRLTPESGSSLMVLLHGAGAHGSNLATFFRYWPRENYVVCAPQATRRVWTPPDLEKVRRIIKVLQTKLPIDVNRLHVAGFSNGASNLHALAFAETLRPRSGTWVGGGFGGGAIPAWARSRFGALFMVGGQDRALRMVRQSVPRLEGRIRSVELRVDPDIGHTWPTSELEYHLWWVGVQEGRYVPGKDENFVWDDDLEEAIAIAQRGEKRGVLVYVFDPVKDRTNAHGKTLQNGVLMDAAVRRLGAQLEPVLLEREPSAEALSRLGVDVEQTPALILIGPTGRPRETLSGRIGVDALRGALERVIGSPPR